MKKIKGFTTLEIVILLTVVVAAMLAMQIYFKRALSGKWKASVDAIGFGRQY